MKRHILAFGAHPDDIEFGCGAVLIKEAQSGNQVSLLVCSRGESGTSGTPETREQEARCAARKTGAEIEFLEMGGDSHISVTVKNTIYLAQKIREYQPDILLAPTPDENQHPDHLAVSRLVRDACRLARYGGLPELKDVQPHTISSLYYYAVTRFTVTPPDIIVDITEFHDQWLDAMRCHHTQLQNKSYLELQESRARYLGLSSGVDYAMGLWANDPVLIGRLSDIAVSSRNF